MDSHERGSHSDAETMHELPKLPHAFTGNCKTYPTNNLYSSRRQTRRNCERGENKKPLCFIPSPAPVTVERFCEMRESAVPSLPPNATT